MILFMHSKNTGEFNLPDSILGAGYTLAKKRKKKERNERETCPLHNGTFDLADAAGSNKETNIDSQVVKYMLSRK